MTHRVAAIVVLAALHSVASAQSQRYLPPPLDPDVEREQSSDFWQRVISPKRANTDDKLTTAIRLLESREVQDAMAILDEAIAAANDAPGGYALRGVAREQLGNWAGCAADYRQARVLASDYQLPAGVRPRGNLDHGAGICLARAGELELAEDVLSRAASSGATTPDLWLRLGEVHLAQGRLHDALADLDRALIGARVEESILVHWMRMLAFDRQRRPAEASAAGETAAALDRHASRVLIPALPMVIASDQLYASALAMDAIGQPEMALPYFREYLRVVPDGPWTQRAKEHVAALRRHDFSSRWVPLQSAAAADPAVVRAALRKILPAARRCLRDWPGLAIEVRTATPLASPRASKGRSRTAAVPPPPMVAPELRVVLNLSGAPPTTALACVSNVVTRLRLSPPLRAGWIQLRFPIVSD